jgi:adenine-specific DNA methylase
VRGTVHPGAAGDVLPRLYPAERHRGQKRDDLDRIMGHIPPWAESFGEAFGGSGIVGWRAKTLGLKVVTNDIMAFSCLRARALITNGQVLLGERELDMLCEPNPHRLGIVREWYTTALGYANAAWLDDFAANLPRLGDPVKRDVATYLSIISLMGRMNYPQVRFTCDRRFAGIRHLDGFAWGREFRRQALELFPRLLHDNGLDNEACRQDAPEFIRSHPIDCLYLDPPFVGPSRYEQDLGFYDKLCLILEGRHAEVGDPFNGPVRLPLHTSFVTRNSALMGLALVFRAAASVRRIILSYNSTSGIHPDEIVSDGERIHGPLVVREEWGAPIPTSSASKPRVTRNVLLVFDRH